MQYLVFGVLLILGTVGMGLFFYLSHARNRVEAVVLESFCDIKRNGQEIKSIDVTHVFELEFEGENRKIETDLFPVRELKGAKVTLYYDRISENVYVPHFTKYFPVLCVFLLSGVICFTLYWIEQSGLKLFQEFSGVDWLAFLLGVISVITFSNVTMLINPAVLKTKGNFEGILKSEDNSSEAEIYSLWYGEHRQYAKRLSGMQLKQKDEKTVTLLFNTKTGCVCRLHEFVISMSVSVVAFLAMVAIFIVCN